MDYQVFGFKRLSSPSQVNEQDFNILPINEQENLDSKYDNITKADLKAIIDLIKLHDRYQDIEVISKSEAYDHFIQIVEKTDGKIINELPWIYCAYKRYKKLENPRTSENSVYFMKQIGSAITKEHLTKAKNLTISSAKKIGKHAVPAVKTMGKSFGQSYMASVQKKPLKVDNTTSSDKDKHATYKSIGSHLGNVAGKSTRASLKYVKSELEKQKKLQQTKSPVIGQDVEVKPPSYALWANKSNKNLINDKNFNDQPSYL